MTNTSLTLKQAAGQRIMAGFHGTRLTDDLKILIGRVKVGGIILFSRNIENPDQLAKLNADAQDYAKACGQPPLFIAIDQEGGCVARLRPPEFPDFPGAPSIRTLDDAIAFGNLASRELNSTGINMNMAPVLDVAPKEINSIMKDRVFSHNPGIVGIIGAAIIDTMQQAGIMSVAKHFPGIGRTVSDSHVDRPDLNTPLEIMEEFDLTPFSTAIKHDVAGIMLSHIRYTSIDPNWPASLSNTLASTLLRKNLGFNGLVITDDLDMGAIKKHYGITIAIQRIIESGIDIALICHTMEDIEAAAQIFEKDLTDDTGTGKENLKASRRIMQAKEKFLAATGI
ncbi:MAG: beta-N-acetylhexosaminidase [Deltaproteobacteria bacterium]|nr:beta-N-acetylhexosaminidase [Deltaproteobacteria bacterium]